MRQTSSHRLGSERPAVPLGGWNQCGRLYTAASACVRWLSKDEERIPIAAPPVTNPLATGSEPGLSERGLARALDPGTLAGRLAAAMKLVETTCRLASEHDLDRILKKVTADVCEALACERGTLYLYDEARRELYTQVATELEIEEIRTTIESGISGWVARRLKVANVPDPQVDARWNSAIDRKTGFHTRNILAAPLLSRERTLVGVLQLLNKHDGSFDEFDEQLLLAFASHAASALERSLLLNEARNAQRLQLEIDMGRSIQTEFLPASLPQIDGYEIAAWWEPAEQVSGDYYDLVDLPDGRLGLVVADVSGHGVASSLIMASVRAMLRVLAKGESQPEKILSALSHSIDPDLGSGRFITCLLAALNPATHEIAFANAGHSPALHFARSTGTFHELPSGCPPIGFSVEHAVTAGKPVAMEPGDLLVLATDGTIELKNEQGEMFGTPRLESLIRENRRQPAPNLLGTIRAAIAAFHPARRPPDDITLLILERKRGA